MGLFLARNPSAAEFSLEETRSKSARPDARGREKGRVIRDLVSHVTNITTTLSRDMVKEVQVGKFATLAVLLFGLVIFIYTFFVSPGSASC